jgi:F-type H+-transporting ATPase subunit delta
LVAQRYAKALLQIGERQNSVHDLQQEINSAIGLVRSQPDLEKLCMHPLIPPSKKAAVFDEILAHAGASETVRRFFVVVAKAARLNLAYDLATAFNELVDKHQGIISANVISAQELSETQKQRLTESFARVSMVSDKKVRFSMQQDPSLLGGLKVQVGSIIYDASLKGRLRLLKERLLSA